jgi:hypothetical protein
MYLNILLTVLLTFSLGMNQAYGGEDLYSDDLKASRFNEYSSRMQDSPIRINYDDEEQTFVFYIMQPMGMAAFLADSVFISELLTAAEKFDEWNTKAIEKQVKLEKDISMLKTGMALWKSGDEWKVMYPISISTGFFSQNVNRHQFTLAFEKMVSLENQYIDFKPETLYLDHEDVLGLMKIFSEDYFKKWHEELIKQRAVDDEFN